MYGRHDIPNIMELKWGHKSILKISKDRGEKFLYDSLTALETIRYKAVCEERLQSLFLFYA
jgi:hypothetical protein